MRNRLAVTLTLLATFTAGAAALAQTAAPAAPPAAATTTPAPAADATAAKPAPATPPKPSAATPQRFEPSEKVRADFDVSFPIDI
jgi:hypothetical protein